MTAETSRSDLPPQVLEEASDWVIEFGSGELDATQRARFNEWVRRSPEHLRAYFEMGAMWEEARAFDPQVQTDPEALYAEAIAASNVIPLSGARAQAFSSQPGHRRPIFAAAAVLFLAIGLIGTWVWTQRTVHSTALGEQRSILLDDGTTVALNSQTKLRVSYSAQLRNIELLRGQALFDVSHDPRRPFEVQSGDTTVRAIGTQFDVYRKPTGTIVTVVEGRISVRSVAAESGREQPAPAVVSAGEQVTVSPHRPARPERADVAAVTAWTQRQLVFDRTPLADAVEEINRYSRRRLIIEDRHLNDFHIRGTFTTTDPEPLVQFLSKRFGFTVRESDGEIRLSQGSAE